MTTESFGPSAILTPANGVTLARIFFAPAAFALMIADRDRSSWLLVSVWFVLSFSDMLDGRLARKYGSTRSGAFLDPLADKILVLGGVGSMCLGAKFTWGWFALALIVFREVAISIYRATYVKHGLAIPASKMAKWKTFVQLAAVGWVTWPWTTDFRWLSDATLWVGVGLGLVSGVQYLVAGSRAATTMAR